jgi:glycosyltransferase involved in cell wall biosynthesis
MLQRLKDNLRPYLPRNIRGTLRAMKERGSAHSHIFSEKPAVISLIWGSDRVVIHDVMANRPLTLLYLFAWSVTAQDIPGMSTLIRNALKRHPKHRVVMLCNELFTVDLFRAQGIEAIFCSHNCYVNENYFTVDPNAVKKYDAIYNATMAPYKRHQLAAKVESLALITYRYGGTHTGDYEQQIRAALAHAAWVVDAFQDGQKATAADVARYYNQSRVGLCLSAKEGAMFASIEYLLCGLPVVTSHNTGGRDAFFDPEYVEWVDDDPEAVRQGVANLIARAPDAAFIRAKTLAKMEEHRQRLRDLLKDTLPKIEIPWQPGTHGPLTFRNLREVGQRLRHL